jgi:hypothetical protein
MIVVCWRSCRPYADELRGDNGQLEKFENVRLPELTPVANLLLMALAGTTLTTPIV